MKYTPSAPGSLIVEIEKGDWISLYRGRGAKMERVGRWQGKDLPNTYTVPKEYEGGVQSYTHIVETEDGTPLFEYTAINLWPGDSVKLYGPVI